MKVMPRYRGHYEGEGGYERFSARYIKSIVKNAEIIVDIGANYGFYSVLAGTSNQNIKIIAVEPVSETREVLQAN